MHVYVYKAAFCCESCGDAIRHRLTDAGKAPDNPYDEESYDSDQFPKGPYDTRYLEFDCTEICDICGTELTDE